jgi:hypothetical protein
MQTNTRRGASANYEVPEHLEIVPRQFDPRFRRTAPEYPAYADPFARYRRDRISYLLGVLGRFIRARFATRPGHDPVFGRLDMIENDYYRFLASPGD